MVETTDIDLMLVDIHGNLRGKRLPGAQRDKILAGEVRLPVSTLFQDIWGNDNDEITGLAISIGDPDGVCIADEATESSMPWRQGHSQILSSMHLLDGAPCFADPRLILKAVLDKCSALGLFPVVAFELEFYLLDADNYAQHRAKPPAETLAYSENDKEMPGPMNLYDMRSMDQLQSVLETIQSFAKAQSLPVEAALGEFGPGQFEINLAHNANGLLAADQATLFKRSVDCAARHCGLAATFMAKPYTEHGGNGMHLHVSVLDKDGNNVFDSGEEGQVNDTLQHAVAGVLNTMEDTLAVYAPNANSYRRLQPDHFTPMNSSWSLDHRAVAMRLPQTSGKAARFECRTPGADANPYLVLSCVLGGMLTGMSDKRKPDTPAVMPGDAMNGKPLTHDWLTAIEAMAQSDFISDTLGTQFQKVYTDVKRSEANRISSYVSDIELQTYLTRI